MRRALFSGLLAYTLQLPAKDSDPLLPAFHAQTVHWQRTEDVSNDDDDEGAAAAARCGPRPRASLCPPGDPGGDAPTRPMADGRWRRRGDDGTASYVKNTVRWLAGLPVAIGPSPTLGDTRHGASVLTATARDDNGGGGGLDSSALRGPRAPPFRRGAPPRDDPGGGRLPRGEPVATERNREGRRGPRNGVGPLGRDPSEGGARSRRRNSRPSIAGARAADHAENERAAATTRGGAARARSRISVDGCARPVPSDGAPDAPPPRNRRPAESVPRARDSGDAGVDVGRPRSRHRFGLRTGDGTLRRLREARRRVARSCRSRRTEVEEQARGKSNAIGAKCKRRFQLR